MVTRAAHCSLCWALLLILQGAGTLATTPSSSCSKYVLENGNLTCACTGSCSGSVQPTFSWQQGTSTVSLNASLVKTDVKRQDNGTQFTCWMDCGGQKSSDEYVLLVYYGPTQEYLHIEAAGTIIAGVAGTGNLTCIATKVYPKPTYTWYHAPCDGHQGTTCIFVPERKHKNVTVICQATAGYFATDQPKADAKFLLDVHYPPTANPLIKGYPTAEILTNGSTLYCIVSDSNPPVSQVSFYCDGHPDQNDTINQSSAKSTVTINSSWITDESMMCVCTATWPTQPDLYLVNSTVTVPTEYKAVVKNFTINDTWPSLEVAAVHRVTVVFTCNASGMPLPGIWLYNRTNGSLKSGNSSVSYTVHGVTIKDMGTYKCSAENVYGTSDTCVRLLVKSLPQGADTSNSKDNSTLLTADGLNFAVLMYPNPHPFNYTFYGRGGNQTSQAIPADMFSGTAVRETSSSPVVVCSIKPLQSITEEKLGLYDVLIANDLGKYHYFFEIMKTIQIGPDPRQNWVIPVAVVLSIVAAVLAVVAAVVFVKRKAVCKNKGTQAASHRESSTEITT